MFSAKKKIGYANPILSDETKYLIVLKACEKLHNMCRQSKKNDMDTLLFQFIALIQNGSADSSLNMTSSTFFVFVYCLCVWLP